MGKKNPQPKPKLMERLNASDPQTVCMQEAQLGEEPGAATIAGNKQQSHLDLVVCCSFCPSHSQESLWPHHRPQGTSPVQNSPGRCTPQPLGAPYRRQGFISLLYCSGWAACKELPEGLTNVGICLSMHLRRNEKRVIKGRGR